MAAQSVYNEIKRRVEKSKRGRLFFPDDFHPASSDAVRSALVRLCRAGDLMRVAQGIYCYPKVDRKWGSGIIPPSIEEIAEAIAKRDKVRIAPTGAYVLNKLGLSTQIPANVVFVTDGFGTSRVYREGQGHPVQAYIGNANFRFPLHYDATYRNRHARDWRTECDRRTDGRHQKAS